jgi:hypothetical protein
MGGYCCLGRGAGDTVLRGISSSSACTSKHCEEWSSSEARVTLEAAVEGFMSRVGSGCFRTCAACMVSAIWVGIESIFAGCVLRGRNVVSFVDGDAHRCWFGDRSWLLV